MAVNGIRLQELNFVPWQKAMESEMQTRTGKMMCTLFATNQVRKTQRTELVKATCPCKSSLHMLPMQEKLPHHRSEMTKIVGIVSVRDRMNQRTSEARS